MGWYDDHSINELVGKTLVRVELNDGRDVLEFETVDGDRYQLYHYQDCCESVWLEDVNGDFDDLIGSPLLIADEVTNLEHDMRHDGPRDEYHESYTWTYYKLHTIKGGVHLRWYGTSNGYYSERVDFRKL